MRNQLKGGVESIIAIVVIVGIIIALIIATVLPIADEGKELGQAGTSKISKLTDAIK